MIGSYIKTIGGWKPDDRYTQDEDARYKLGTVAQLEIKQPRSKKQHARMMAFLQVVFDNQDRYPSLDALLTDVKLKVGHYNKHINWKLDKDSGEYVDSVVMIPKSISFGSMDQAAFQQFQDWAYDVVIDDIIPGIGREELERAVEEFDNRGTI